MRRHAPLVVAALVLAALAAAAPLAAREPRRTLRLDFEDDHDGGLSLTFDGAWVTGLAAALAVADLDCDTTTDPDLAALLRHLEREGEGARAELREDGYRVVARRRGGHLELEVIDHHGERAEVVVPWALARCMLGGDVTLRDALGALRAGGLHLLVRGEDGSLRLSLD